MEYLAHLRLGLNFVLVMHRAAVLDGSALDALALQQNGLSPAEIDISRGQVVQALVMAPVFMSGVSTYWIKLARDRLVIGLRTLSCLRVKHPGVCEFDIYPGRQLFGFVIPDLLSSRTKEG
jgi:hypothetical protein